MVFLFHQEFSTKLKINNKKEIKKFGNNNDEITNINIDEDLNILIITNKEGKTYLLDLDLNYQNYSACNENNLKHEKEIIEIWPVIFKGIKVKLALNYRNWEKIKFIAQSNIENKNEFKKQIKCILNNINFSDNLWWAMGTFKQHSIYNYIEILSKVISDNWLDIYNYGVNKLKENQKIVIITWDDLTWHGKDSVEIHSID